MISRTYIPCSTASLRCRTRCPSLNDKIENMSNFNNVHQSDIADSGCYITSYQIILINYTGITSSIYLCLREVT